MHTTYEKLRERYSDSIWLRSETTYIAGPIRNNFDPPDIQERQPQRWRITLTTTSGKHYAIKTCGEIDYLYFDTGDKLLIFRTVFGEDLADFAVVCGKVVNEKQTKNLSAQNRLPAYAKSLHVDTWLEDNPY